MLRGELWWARVPMKGSGGKKRPMLVVSDDAFNRNERYTKVMAVHVTSVKRAGGPYDWEVPLPRGTAGLVHRERCQVRRYSYAMEGAASRFVGHAFPGPHATSRPSIGCRAEFSDRELT